VRYCYDNATEAGKTAGNAVFFLRANNETPGVVTSFTQQRHNWAIAPFQNCQRPDQ
jgi:hypothetical protein